MSSGNFPRAAGCSWVSGAPRRPRRSACGGRRGLPSPRAGGRARLHAEPGAPWARPRCPRLRAQTLNLALKEQPWCRQRSCVSVSLRAAVLRDGTGQDGLQGGLGFCRRLLQPLGSSASHPCSETFSPTPPVLPERHFRLPSAVRFGTSRQWPQQRGPARGALGEEQQLPGLSQVPRGRAPLLRAQPGAASEGSPEQEAGRDSRKEQRGVQI